METLESILRFLNSYPMWAKVSALGALVAFAAVLTLAPRADPLPKNKGMVLRLLAVDNRSLVVGPIQVDIIVNDQTFRYPSLAQVQWMELGPEMTPQTFKLPVSSVYEVRFELRLRDRVYPKEVKAFASQKTVSVGTFPFHDLYTVYEVDGATHGKEAMVIRFSIEREGKVL